MQSVYWENGSLCIIDQTQLPRKKVILELKSLDSVYDAIKQLSVRGAPAIGVTAAYGIVVGLKEGKSFNETYRVLASSRPTAVNLFWALDRMKRSHSKNSSIDSLLNEAVAIHDEDRLMCEQMGNFTSELIPENANIITHCNTGFLATGGIGTALAGIYKAHEQGKKPHVFVDETRPLLQGARLTAWELSEAGIDATLISDNMAAHVMKTKKIDLVIVGSDRIAANGDAANKIGTYGLSVLAKAHNIPFYVVAPTSTFDLTLSVGDEIPIEERDGSELRYVYSEQIAPETINTYNPAFDVTPNENITAIVCEKGILEPDYKKTIEKTFK